MAGLPEGFTIDTPVAPTGSGLPAGFTIDQPAAALSGGYNDDDFKKSLATGLVKFGTSALGLPVTAANALNKAVSGLTGSPAPAPIVTGSPQYLQDKFSQNVAPLHTPTTNIGSWAETGGEIAPQMMGPGGLVTKAMNQVAAPYVASQTASHLTEGTPYQDLATLGAGLAVGARGVKANSEAPAVTVDNPSVTSAGLRSAGADPALVQKIQTLERAKLKADTSDKPINQTLRDNLSGMLLDDNKRDQFSPEDQSGIQGLIDTGPSKVANTAAKGWGLGMGAGLLAENIPVVGPVLGSSVIAGSALAKGLSKLGDIRTNKAFETLKANIAANHVPDAVPVSAPGPGPTGPKIAPAPQPWATQTPAPEPPAAPTMPDPTQLKLQMDKLVNERRVLARAQAAAQPAPPPAPPPINPLALPTSITTPAKNIMGGLADAQAMQAKSNPLAKYEDAVRMNAGIDRANNSALTRDATGQMAARLSKKAGGAVKETAAPQAEAPAPEAAAPVSSAATPLELPQSDYSHLPRATAAKLITDRVFAAGKDKNIHVTRDEYQAGVEEKLMAKERIADDIAKVLPNVEHQDINAHLQGAKTKAQATDVLNHYIKLYPEAEAAIKLAMAKKRLNAGWTR